MFKYLATTDVAHPSYEKCSSFSFYRADICLHSGAVCCSRLLLSFGYFLFHSFYHSILNCVGILVNAKTDYFIFQPFSLIYPTVQWSVLYGHCCMTHLWAECCPFVNNYISCITYSTVYLTLSRMMMQGSGKYCPHIIRVEVIITRCKIYMLLSLQYIYCSFTQNQAIIHFETL